MMTNPLPTDRARAYCVRLQESLDAHTCLDFEGACVVGTDYLFSAARGQMFGVLVCVDDKGHEVVLKAFSGQYDGRWLVDGWVPPALDVDQYEALLQDEPPEDLPAKVHALHRFHCIDGTVWTIQDIFGANIPPTGTGDCCAPKLLNEACKRHLVPLSMAEFYYGEANRSGSRVHKEFYPPCDARCKPVLAAMLGLDMLYVDESIIVVNKPAGLLSVPGRGEQKQDCIVSRVKRLFPFCIEQPSVHRLDMDTSGLLVLAFTQSAHRDLSIQFIKRTVRKRYVALLEGVVKEERGRIELSFSYDPDHKPRQKYDPVLGKRGTTLWEKARVEPLGRTGRHVTRVLFTPITGRTHQLRLHSASEHGLGHPIVGDPLYGDGNEAPRLMLHACELAFTHPVTGEPMHFMLDPDF